MKFDEMAEYLKESISVELSIEKSFIFILNPKVCSTSIRRVLRASVGDLRCVLLKNIYDYISEDDFNSFFKFGFVRNPWDRMVSNYSFMKQIGDKFPAQIEEMNFSEYVDFVEKSLNGDIDDVSLDYVENLNPSTRFIGHVIPQEYIFLNNDFTLDFVGRFENIENDWMTVAERIGVPHSFLPIKNESEHLQYQEYYEEDVVDKVFSIYKKEIDYFEYKFDERIRCGLLGFGYWGNILYNEIMKLKSHYKLMAVCDRNDEKIEDIEVDKVSSFSEFLDYDIDLVFIATQTKFHKKHIIECFKRGKDVFVEKPITDSIKDAKRVIDLSNKLGRKIFVDNVFTSSPELLEIKKRALGKEFYKFYSRRINVLNNTFDINIIWNLLYHDIYIVDYLFGLKYKNLKIIANKIKHDFVDDVYVSFDLDDMNVCLHSSYVHHEKVRDIGLIGEETNLLWKNEVFYEISDGDLGVVTSPRFGGLHYKLKDVYDNIVKGKGDESKYESLRAIEFISKIERKI